MRSPLIPMGAMTGKPDEKRMREVLSAWKQAGVDQFLLYPRSGMEYAYMSEEWLDICEKTVRLAKDMDMQVWLYDEYNWPSGNCCGQVTQGHPEYWPHAVTFEKTGSGVEICVVQNRIGADILNPDAVERFISLTHQRYYDRFGDCFGSVVQGVYTDEPSFSYFTRDLAPRHADTDPDGFLSLPWYEGLEEDYLSLCGQDFRKDVSLALAGTPPEGLWERVYTLLGNRMRDVFIGKMDDWCQRHGVVLTGHLMEEDAPNSVFFNGNPLKMLSRFSLPGLDDITTHLKLDYEKTMDRPTDHLQLSALSLCQYAARGKAGALAELFALGPTDLPLARMRQMIRLCACFGVDHYVLAVAALDARGNLEKDGYYFPTGLTAPWFPYYRELEREAEKAARDAKKPYAPSVRVRFPTSLFMRLSRRMDNPLQPLFRSFLEALVRFQVQYLYLDEGEETSLPVLSMDEKGLFIEGEQEHFLHADAFLRHVLLRHPQDFSLTDEDGAPCRDMLIRRWADGTYTIVSLAETEESRSLVLHAGGKKALIALPPFGVWSGRPDEPAEIQVPSAMEPLACGPVSLRLAGPNLMRCLFTDAAPEFRFLLTEPLAGLRVLARTDAAPVTVYLDGRAVPCPCAAGGLPDGFAQLYTASAPFSLSKGEHVMTLGTGGTDSRFLPAAYIQGSFLALPEHTLAPFRADAAFAPLAGLANYAGTYDLLTDADIPSSARALGLDPALHCTEVFLNGTSLGKKAWPPYVWEIPEAFRGSRARLTVRLSTSAYPLSGDTALLDGEHPYPYWVKVRPGVYAFCGLRSHPILYRN